MPFREDLPTLWRYVAAPVPRKRREYLDGFYRDLLRKMTVPLGHAKVRMARELLHGPHGDAAHREPRTEIMAEIVEPEPL